MLGWTALALAGCGGGAAETAEKSEKKSSKKATAKAESPKPKPPPPKPLPKPTVPQDLYPDVPTALASLKASAEGGDPKTRIDATLWLSQQGDAAAGPVGKLAGDETASVASRIAACRVLSQFGPKSPPVLVALLKAKEPLVRINAADQLALIEPHSEEIIDVLIGLVGDKEEQMRAKAIGCLAHIGTAAKKAGPMLQSILNNTKESALIRGHAKEALLKVDPRKTFVD